MTTTQDWHPPEDDLTRLRTSDKVNQRIDRETRGALAEIGDSPEAIRARLAELDQEWQLDRALIALFSVVGSLTASRAMRTLRREGRHGVASLMVFTQMSFLLYYAIRGWCPPIPVLRRLGFRTAREISAERCLLEKRLGMEDGF